MCITKMTTAAAQRHPPAVLFTGVRVSHVRLHVHSVRRHDLLVPDIPRVQSRVLRKLEPRAGRLLLARPVHGQL
jgi:hypothetical protein